MSRRLPNILQMREAPVFGRYYRVPCIYGKYYGVHDWYPVLLPAHTDGEIFPNFPWHHYHIDHRFMTVCHLRRISNRLRSAREVTCGSPIIVIGKGLPDTPLHIYYVEATQKPSMRRRKCQFDNPGFLFRSADEIKKLRQNFREGLGGAQCIRTPSGRALCPHQRVDLSSYPVAIDGTVICPAHGLKVRVAA